MRTSLLYILFTSIAVAMIYGIIRYGNTISAPAALPKAWRLEIEGASEACGVFPAREARLALSQSGETISVRLGLPAEVELHGKLGRDGAFRLAGKVPRRRVAGCVRGEMLWEGTATAQALEGWFSIGGPDCAVCPEPLRILGSPER